MFLRRSSAVGSSFLNTLLSNTSHRESLAGSRTETGVARLPHRKETLISFQGPVRPVTRHYFWFKITASHLLVIQLIQKLLANVAVDIRSPGFDYIVQYCTNYICYFRASSSKILCTSTENQSKNKGKLTCVEQHFQIHANVLARKGIYPTKLTKVCYPYITELEITCSNISATSFTSNCEQYIARLVQKSGFHSK